MFFESREEPRIVLLPPEGRPRNHHVSRSVGAASGELVQRVGIGCRWSPPHAFTLWEEFGGSPLDGVSPEFAVVNEDDRCPRLDLLVVAAWSVMGSTTC